MELESHEKQKLKDGYGAVYHRVYSIRISEPLEAAAKVMEDLQKDPNKFSPQVLANFEKVSGRTDELKSQDEFQIHITGPWNGPVRVENVTCQEFRLITLKGHLEAGEIFFRIKKAKTGETVFEIESLARSRDAIIDFFYDKVPIAKFAQTEMWCSFCKTFAKNVIQSCGKDVSEIAEVEVLTERRDEETGQWQRI